MHAILLSILIIAASTWIGGLPTLIIVRRAAGRTLDPAASVALFRATGRIYGAVAGAALVIATLCAALLAGSPARWATWQITCAALTAAMAVVTGVGVIQARSITRRKQDAIDRGEPTPQSLKRTIVAATILRALIAALTIAIITSASLGLS